MINQSLLINNYTPDEHNNTSGKQSFSNKRKESIVSTNSYYNGNRSNRSSSSNSTSSSKSTTSSNINDNSRSISNSTSASNISQSDVDSTNSNNDEAVNYWRNKYESLQQENENTQIYLNDLINESNITLKQFNELNNRNNYLNELCVNTKQILESVLSIDTYHSNESNDKNDYNIDNLIDMTKKVKEKTLKLIKLLTIPEKSFDEFIYHIKNILLSLKSSDIIDKENLLIDRLNMLCKVIIDCGIDLDIQSKQQQRDILNSYFRYPSEDELFEKDKSINILNEALSVSKKISNELRLAYDQKSHQFEELKMQLDSNIRNQSTIILESQETKDELSEYKQQLELKQLELNELRKNYDELILLSTSNNEKIVDLQSKNSYLVNMIAEMEIDDKNEEIVTLNNKSKSLSDKLDKKTKEYEDIYNKYIDVKNQMIILQQNEITLHSSLNILNKSFYDLQVEYDNHIENAENIYLNKVNDVLTNLSNEQEKNRNYKDLLDKRNNEYELLIKKIELLDEQLIQSRKYNNELHNQFNEIKLQYELDSKAINQEKDLKSDYNTCINELNEERKLTNEYKNKLNDKIHEYEILYAEFKILENHLLTITSNKSSYQIKQNPLVNSIKAIDKVVSSSMDQKNSKIIESLNYKAKYEETNERLQQLLKVNVELKSKINILSNKQLSPLPNRPEDSADINTTNRIIELEKLCNDYNNECIHILNINKQLNQSNELLNKQINILNNLINQNYFIKQLNKQLTTYLNDNQQLTTVNKQLNDEIISNKINIQTKTDAIEYLNIQLNDLKNINHQLQMKYEETIDNNKHVKYQLDNYIERYNNCYNQCVKLHDQIVNMNNIFTICRITSIRSISRNQIDNKIDCKEDKNIPSDVTNAVDMKSDSKMVIESNQIQYVESTYKFDKIFYTQNNQINVFNQIESSIHLSLCGLNTCILSYGNNFTKKSYTLFGDPDDWGLLYQTISLLLTIISNDKPDIRTTISLSGVQLHDDIYYDLISGEIVNAQYNHLNDVIGNFKQFVIKSMDDIIQFLFDHFINISNDMIQHRSKSFIVVYVKIERRIISSSSIEKSVIAFVQLPDHKQINLINLNAKELKQYQIINQTFNDLSNLLYGLNSRNNDTKLIRSKDREETIHYYSKLISLLSSCLYVNSKVYLISHIDSENESSNDVINNLVYCNKIFNAKALQMN